jgi:hypothetical protein
LTQGNAQIYGKEIRIYRARYTVSFSEYSPIFVLAGKNKKNLTFDAFGYSFLETTTLQKGTDITDGYSSYYCIFGGYKY